MKEKIIKILKSHSYHHTEGVGVKSQFKYLAEIAFECCADEIMLALDQSQFTADEAEEHINQEVERRIKERMPTKIDAQKKIFEICSHPDNIGKGLRGIISTPMKLEMYDEWYRSRLTNPGAESSQKTEGGGE